MPSKSLLQPQEIEVFYVIPTLRKYLAISMKKQGLKQKQIASLLDIEDATVSQYVNDKRGNKIALSNDIQKEISKSSLLIRDKTSLIREMQKLLRIIQETREICKIHKTLADVPQDCSQEAVLCYRR